MSSTVIRPVFSRREQKLFLSFPWQLYRDDPHWVPPLRYYQKEMVGYRPHPFYHNNLAQTFLAYRDGEVCGRIAAILNRDHIFYRNDRRGFFGFFESVDDPAVADALFDAVRQWFAAQGIFKLRGPTNPSQNYEVGLLVDGFDSTPTFMMPYNKPYYPALLEGYGWQSSQNLYSFWGDIDMLPKVREKLRPIAEQIIERFEVKLRTLDRKHFREDVEKFLEIFNRSMVNTWNFVPMSQAEVQHIAAGLRHLLVPELACAAEVDGRMVGVALGVLDYNPRIKQIDGRLYPFGFLRLLRNKADIPLVRMISTNVLPAYQLMGIPLALQYAMLPVLQDKRFNLRECEFSWVMESNSLSFGSLKKGGAKIVKTHRLYDLDDEPADATEEPIALRLLKADRSVPATLGQVGGALRIREVRTQQQLRQFIDVPWRIYADDPNWVPPLRYDVKNFLDRRAHPFYQHGEATTFVACRGDEPVGRILATDDPHYNERHGTNVGSFGMFESPNDPEVAHGLLEAAATWLRARGRTGILGPVDYATNYPSGLLIDGFETPPRVMMNHHPIYYAGLLDSWGLRKAKDLYAWWFLDPRDLIGKWKDRAERLTKRGRLTIRSFRKSDFQAEVQRCREVYNGAMHDNWGFVPLTDAEFTHFGKQLASLANPEMILLAEVGGQTVGFSATLPDFNEAIRPLNGRLMRYGMPLGLAEFAYRRRHIKTARMICLDILPKYRRRGIAELLILRTLDYGKNVLGYTGAELSWTLEDNEAINQTLEQVGARRYKTYRIYEKEIV